MRQCITRHICAFDVAFEQHTLFVGVGGESQLDGCGDGSQGSELANLYHLIAVVLNELDRKLVPLGLVERKAGCRV